MRHFESLLYRYFLTAHGNPQLAGEQSADCFGDLVEVLPKMSGGAAQLRPFVFGVARNVLRRQWRRRELAGNQPLTDEMAFDQRPAPDMEIEATEEARELSRRYVRSIHRTAMFSYCDLWKRCRSPKSPRQLANPLGLLRAACITGGNG